MRTLATDRRSIVAWACRTALAMALLAPLAAARSQAFDRLRDRGTGIPTSMFGTYVRPHELLVYPFFEYYRDADAEYSPDEFGYGLDQDYRGRYWASERLVFVSYGFTPRLAVELEAANITARQERAPDDPSPMPQTIRESGLGDVEGQARWRWNTESARRPEVFSFFETAFPLQRTRRLIGTRDWELKLGTGVARGFRWGTATVRAAIEYDGEDGSVALGEYALEYLKRISPRLRLVAAVEGDQDEVEQITEAQWFLAPNVYLKLNNSFGLTSKATDWAPEIGIMFSFR
jgi:hypothetical protein